MLHIYGKELIIDRIGIGAYTSIRGSSVITDQSKSLAQSRNKVRASVIDRIKGLKSDLKEMASARDFDVFVFFAFSSS